MASMREEEMSDRHLEEIMVLSKTFDEDDNLKNVGIDANGSHIDIITDQEIVADLHPTISIQTGLVDEPFIIRINPPKGRALLIAVHL
jgi:hypothetical protein